MAEMTIDSSAIASIIRRNLEQYAGRTEREEVGEILQVGDGIARISGLRNTMAAEMLEFDNGSFGLAMNLEEHEIGAAVLGNYLDLQEGSPVKRTGKVLQVPAGPALLGRVVDPVGRPLDNKGPIQTDVYRPLESPAPGIADRQPVKVPLQTGIKAIDAMIPIGRGQRELIIGDRKTGKTAIGLDTIINQQDSGVICVYVAIGQKASTVAGVVQKLEEVGAMEYTIVVVASSNDPAPLQYIAPYAGCAMAEHFMYQEQKDTLCVYDDLSKQAAAYRELSLLLRRPPGREAFPGDVFYLHSRLLERSAKLSDALGGGSLTALPMIETQEGEVSAYIPTNVISITDGQIYLQPDLFNSGVRPAVDVGISVSRVGGNAQIKAMKKVAGTLRLDLAQFRELEAFAQLGTELDKATQAQLDRGMRLVELLKQGQYVPVHVIDQVVAVYAATRGHMDDVPLDGVGDFESGLVDYLHGKYQELLDAIGDAKEISDERAAMLDKAVEEFKSGFAR